MKAGYELIFGQNLAPPGPDICSTRRKEWLLSAAGATGLLFNWKTEDWRGAPTRAGYEACEKIISPPLQRLQIQMDLTFLGALAILEELGAFDFFTSVLEPRSYRRIIPNPAEQDSDNASNI